MHAMHATSRHSAIAFAAATLSAVCFSSVAAAAEPTYDPSRLPPAPVTVGARTHDGFYLRMAIGLSYFSLSSEASSGTSSASAKVSGLGVGGEFLLGGTVAPGFVIGGGSQGGVLPSGASGTLTSVTNGVSRSSDVKTNDSGVVTILGPFMDYYFNPREGLHVQAMLGYGQYKVGSGSGSTSTGFGLSAGFGNEWWVGDEWSIGILGRIQYLSLKGESFGPVTPSVKAFIPGLLVSFTYH